MKQECHCCHNSPCVCCEQCACYPCCCATDAVGNIELSPIRQLPPEEPAYQHLRRHHAPCNLSPDQYDRLMDTYRHAMNHIRSEHGRDAFLMDDPSILQRATHEILVYHELPPEWWENLLEQYEDTETRIDTRQGTIEIVTAPRGYLTGNRRTLTLPYTISYVDLDDEPHYNDEAAGAYDDDPPLYYFGSEDEAAGIFELHAAPDAVEDLLAEYGTWLITDIHVYREKIVAAVKAVAQALMMKKLPSNTYHVFQVLKIVPTKGSTTNKFVRIDKNEDVEVQYLKTWPSSDPKDVRAVNGVKTKMLAVEEYFHMAESWLQEQKIINPTIQNATFWKYNAAGSNCQYFVYWCLKGAGLMTPSLETFFLQRNIQVPSLSARIFKSITSAAAVGSRLFKKLKSKVSGKKRPRKSIPKTMSNILELAKKRAVALAQAQKNGAKKRIVGQKNKR